MRAADAIRVELIGVRLFLQQNIPNSNTPMRLPVCLLAAGFQLHSMHAVCAVPASSADGAAELSRVEPAL